MIHLVLVNGNEMTQNSEHYQNGEAFPNMPTLAFVKFITPEAYPNCLVSGQLIEVCAGAKPIGSATVIEVYNIQLQKRS